MRIRFVLPLLIVASSLLLPVSPASAWTSVAIADHASDPDAAVVNGRSAVTYVRHDDDSNGDAVIYASLENGVWKRSVVAHYANWTDSNPQVALESDGTPWVFFDILYPRQSSLWYRNDSGVWTFAAAIAEEEALDLRTLASGRVAMIHHFDLNQGPLSYSTYDLATDTLDTEQISGKSVSFASMRVLSQVPHVAFGAIDGTLSYATRSTSGWSIQQVASGGNPDRASIALGPNGGPRVAYTSDSGLRYAFRQGGTWFRSLIHADSTAINPSLRTAPSGSPQIAYTTGAFASAGPFVLRFANSTASGWILSVVSSSVGGPHLGQISLVTGTDGRSRIAYNGTSAVRWARP